MPGTATGTGGRRPTRASKAARERVDLMLQLQAEQLEHLTLSEMAAVEATLRAAKREAAAQMAEWMRTFPDDWSQRFSAQQARNALAMGRRVEASFREWGIGDAVEHALGDQLIEAGGRSIHNLERELAVFGEIFDGSVHPVAIAPSSYIAEGQHALMGKYRTSAARYEGQVAGDIRQQISIGLNRNETFVQMTARLQRLGGPRGPVAVRGIRGEPGAIVEDISEGLFARHRSWAERLVRTEGIQAYNAIHERALIAEAADDDEPDPQDQLQKKWDATADRRRCPLCAELDGTVVPVDGEFLGGYRHPPRHPNCRCTIVPWRLRWGTGKHAAAVLAGPPPPPVKEPAPVEERPRRRRQEPRSVEERVHAVLNEQPPPEVARQFEAERAAAAARQEAERAAAAAREEAERARLEAERAAAQRAAAERAAAEERARLEAERVRQEAERAAAAQAAWERQVAEQNARAAVIAETPAPVARPASDAVTPVGFREQTTRRNVQVDGRWRSVEVPQPLLAELPEHATVNPDAAYVLRPSQLASRDLWGNEIHPEHIGSVRATWGAPPPGFDDSKLMPEHREAIAKAVSTGVPTQLDPLDIRVTRDGRYLIEDGNHRLLAAAQLGDRPVLVKFRAVGDSFEAQANARPIRDRIEGAIKARK